MVLSDRAWNYEANATRGVTGVGRGMGVGENSDAQEQHSNVQRILTQVGPPKTQIFI